MPPKAAAAQTCGPQLREAKLSYGPQQYLYCFGRVTALVAFG